MSRVASVPRLIGPVGGGFRSVDVSVVVPWLALMAVILCFSSTPMFLSIANLENILRTLPVLLLLGIGLSIVVASGSIDVSVAGTISVSGAVAAQLVLHFGEKAMPLAIVAGLVIGVANGLLVTVAKLPSFLVTLGTLFVLQGLAKVISDGAPVPFVGPRSAALWSNTVSILGIEIPQIAVGVIILAALVCWLFSVTRGGKYILAIGGSESAAAMSGIRVQTYRVGAFAVSGAFAGTAGIVLAMRSQAATPIMGDPYMLTSIAAVVVGGTSLLGGVGGPSRGVLGCLVMVFLDNGMVLANVDPNAQDVIRGLVILVAAALTLNRRGQVR